ncbi:hypothetical protein B7P43_G04428 [Cryptotermes secundus]|uniref:Uncharacterized protein n=1 Tax=Cryptotermes secundus TaxID=105785 RepID=A0A2J7QJR5_9NEOP|nr:hypothetical protein B7P43_G04428 [Cryptotermes secundus]
MIQPGVQCKQQCKSKDYSCLCMGIGFADGAEVIYDSKSKWNDYHEDVNRTNFNRVDKNLSPVCLSVVQQ